MDAHCEESYLSDRLILSNQNLKKTEIMEGVVRQFVGQSVDSRGKNFILVWHISRNKTAKSCQRPLLLSSITT